MAVLVACEESQMVTIALRERGIEAYSCDTQMCSGARPEWHLWRDVRAVLDRDWDMILAFPPCTHLCSSGARYWKEKQADGRQQAAIDFFMTIANNHCPRIAIENPVGIMSTKWRKPDQIIQPWQFGHGEIKTTCLWLKGLPPLESTCVVDGRRGRILELSPSAERAKIRSKTYPGIAVAMAEQWGRLVKERVNVGG